MTKLTIKNNKKSIHKNLTLRKKVGGISPKDILSQTFKEVGVSI